MGWHTEVSTSSTSTSNSCSFALALSLSPSLIPSPWFVMFRSFLCIANCGKEGEIIEIRAHERTRPRGALPSVQADALAVCVQDSGVAGGFVA